MNTLNSLLPAHFAAVPSGEPFGGSQLTGAWLFATRRATRPEPHHPSMESINESPSKVNAPDEGHAMRECMRLIASRQDRNAFMELYQHFAPKLKSFLLTRGLNAQTADDVLQEAMLAVWQKASNYDSAKANVSTWIFTIARYKCIDRMRSDGRRKTESDEPDLRPADDIDADDTLAVEQNKDSVQAAISRLPEDQQTVVYLSFMKGLAHSEIAEQLGLPLGTVKSRIRRACGRLREDLGELD